MADLLGPKAVEQLREIARRVLREESHVTVGGGAGRPQTTGLAVYICKTSTAGITGMSTADAPGSGTCTIFYRSTGNVLTSTSETLTVRNMTTSSVGASRFIQAKQDVFGSVWVDVEGCT